MRCKETERRWRAVKRMERELFLDSIRVSDVIAVIGLVMVSVVMFAMVVC